MRRLLVGFLATIGFLVLLVAIAGAVSLAWLLRSGAGEALPERMVLVADLRDELPEALPSEGLAALAQGRRLTVSDVVLALDAAGRDPRVAGLLARVDETEHGFAVAQELRQAVAHFRASGRFALAHADTFGELSSGNEGYYLATAFERIELQPIGFVGLTGIAAEMPFLAGLLADLGVEMEVERREEYKTVLDPLVRREITDANREMLDRLVGELAGQLIEGVAVGRGLDPAQAGRLVAGGPYSAQEAQAAGLVDAIRHFDEALDAALAQAGPGTEAVPLEAYAAMLPASAEEASRVAFIRGVGFISRGEGGIGRRIAADTMAKAIGEAAADPRIRAILLRLDTGGGSAVASETVARQVRRAIAAGRPVIVSMGNTAASGGYWIAVEGTTVLAQPATLTGSIGVVAGKPVLRGLWERLGVNWARADSGGNSGMWSINQPYTPAARARVEALLDALYGDFKSNVARGRGLEPGEVEALAKGRVWTGNEAVRLGLADRLGGLPEALAAVREALSLPVDAPLSLEPIPRPQSRLARLLELFDEGLGGVQALLLLRDAALARGPLTAAPLVVR